MEGADGALLQNGPASLFSIIGANEGKAYIWGSWKPPAKYIDGSPRFWFVKQCMGVLERGG